MLAAGISGMLFSCGKEENEPAIESKTFVIDVRNSSGWKYFSFAEDDTIAVSDPSASTEWDLAFQRYRIRTNGGESGKGLGAAANTGQKGQAGFDAVKSADDTFKFMDDGPVSIAVQQGYETFILNPELYTWFTMEQASQGTQIAPSDFVYIVRTATGKYAKIWFKSYYSATNISGHITFQYKYQPDGSGNLE